MEFSPEDKTWIESQPEIKFGPELGSGYVGTVYELEGRPDLVIKIPNILRLVLGLSVPISKITALARMYTPQEIENYNKVKNFDIIAPTQAVKLGIKTATGEDYIGLIRPKLKTSNSDLKTLSEGQLFDIGIESFAQSTDKEKVYHNNNKAWKLFLFCTRKSLSFYGEIQPGVYLP